MDKIRFFDKNGKEIIREPLNLDKVEHIAEIGGTIEKFSIGLNFYSENLQRKEITQILGIEPTKSWNAGEKHQVGNTNKTKITPWGKWHITLKRDGKDLNTKIEELLNPMTNDLKKWKYLTTKYEGWIDVAGYMENWNRGFTLETRIMKMLFDRNLEIVFDMYYYGKDDD
jgi:hypothetical protein